MDVGQIYVNIQDPWSSLHIYNLYVFVLTAGELYFPLTDAKHRRVGRGPLILSVHATGLRANP